MSSTKSNDNRFSKILTIALIASIFLSVISYYFGIQLEDKIYKDLKNTFFQPLKWWINPLIAFSMFGVFFRTPEGKALNFIVLLCDIILLYFISTLIANIFAYNVYDLFPFADIVAPALSGVDATEFTKKSPGGIPKIILIMIVAFCTSIICRYVIHHYFILVIKKILAVINILLASVFFDKISFIKKFKTEYKEARELKNDSSYSMVFINFFDKIIFGILMAILLLSPLAVYSSFLQILNDRGFVFFLDLGKFIMCYGVILLSYKLIVLPIVRTVFTIGVPNKESYFSFLKKGVPVLITAGATASSAATLGVNIKAASGLNVPDDMKDRGHNEALMPVGATFNMDGTSISLVVYFLLGAQLAGIVDISFWSVVLTAVGLSFGTAAVPSASLIMLTSMYQSFSVPAAVTSKLLSIILAVDPIHDRFRTMVNTWGDLNMIYIIQSKRGLITSLVKKISSKK
ncbi:dicarboxylate/amino acid:cation symporter [Rickettsiales bacterium]|nr:dicarboxylate/amino acid:cation symporter [Rickettsiales bacterium]MDB2550558.1 dicarboxylate/amino acid:cation symporter [Rickettsiales bacterium]